MVIIAKYTPYIYPLHNEWFSRVHLGAFENKLRASRSVAPPLCARFAPLRRYADRCCAARQAGRQAKQLQSDQGTLTTTDRLVLGKVRNATFASCTI